MVSVDRHSCGDMTRVLTCPTLVGSCLLILYLCLVSADNDKCKPFPTGQVQANVTDNIQPDDVIHYDFQLSLNLTVSATQVIINITSISLMFTQQDSTHSVEWQLIGPDGNIVNRNTTLYVYTERLFEDNVHSIRFEEIGGENWTLQGSINKLLENTAGAGDLVQSVLGITVTHTDNSTCYTAVSSPYFYLPPPRLLVSSEEPLPVPMMGQFWGAVNMCVIDPHVIGPAVMEVRTPSERSSREVILTIQSSSINDVTGFTKSSTADLHNTPLYLKSTFGSFQYDIGLVQLPTLQRDVANFTTAELTMGFVARAEDYSQLRDDDVVNISTGMTFGRDSGNSDVSIESGGSLIWVSSVPVTLEVPPLDQKRPELNLTISQKSSCAYDGQTEVSVDIEMVHASTSTATAYNVTARVYLTDFMTLLRHDNSEIRQNALSVTQNSTVVYIHIERMTFSDPTTVSLVIDVDLSPPRARLAEHYIITSDAIFSDRWGNNTGMFTSLDFVDLQLDRHCKYNNRIVPDVFYNRHYEWTHFTDASESFVKGQHLNWTTSGQCKCSHDVSRSDCACCVTGACQCGDVNPNKCQPCDRLYLCRPYLDGFEAITQLDIGGGKTTYICDAYHRYRAWSTGISCYKRTGNTENYTWSSVNPIVGTILAHDAQTGSLYGISNNGLAYMRSEDCGVTWYTVRPEDYAAQLASANMEEAVFVPGILET